MMEALEKTNTNKSYTTTISTAIAATTATNINHKEWYSEAMQIELPYIRLDDPTELDPRYAIPHDIQPLNEDKRIRVFCTQLLNDIIDETTLFNFDFHIYFYYKQRFKLQRRFPHREPELIEASIKFWERMQQKYKELKQEDNKDNKQTDNTDNTL